MTPEELLFQNPESSLFENQTELTKFLVETENHDFYGKPFVSVRSLLSKCIRGERRLPNKLRDSLLTVLDSNKSFDAKKVKYIKKHLVDVFSQQFDSQASFRAYKEKEKIRNGLFLELELKTNGIEVNCITSNLNWVNQYLSEIINSAKHNNTTFKYLVVDPFGRKNATRINEELLNNQITNEIQIRSAYEKVGLFQFDSNNSPSLIRTGEIIFPLFEDLVIYKNIPETIKKAFSIEQNEIVVMGSTIYDEDYERLFSDFILDDGLRAIYTMNWFDAMWEACK